MGGLVEHAHRNTSCTGCKDSHARIHYKRKTLAHTYEYKDVLFPRVVVVAGMVQRVVAHVVFVCLTLGMGQDVAEQGRVGCTKI